MAAAPLAIGYAAGFGGDRTDAAGPVVEVAGGQGVSPVPVAQAALLGLHTTGFPVSPLAAATYLVVGLAQVEVGDHQRFTIPFLFGASVLMTLAGVALGVFPA
jgi:CitMHS family citrate-Mg2+:H+ or citrate-Ca2+:H+ symporter